jgi:polysaccharide biosynthesis/export protein
LSLRRKKVADLLPFLFPPFDIPMRKRLFLLATLAIFIAGSLRAEDKTSAGGTSAATPVDYILLPSDLIRVLVFQEPDLQREVRITQEYTINLPLIGSVDLTGKSVRQAEEMIRALYDKDYLVNPQITVTVLEYSPRTVQVIGQVNKPDAISFPPEQKMSLVEAISRAGGPTRLANLRQVRLTRTGADGKTENFVVNVDELIKGGSSDQWLLRKGDVIFVPEKIL